jgi:hypothetical protein
VSTGNSNQVLLITVQLAAWTAGTAFIGIIEGAKNSIAPIKMVLTIFRIFWRIATPMCPGTRTQFPGDAAKMPRSACGDNAAE